jgi:hypothetical protein
MSKIKKILITTSFTILLIIIGLFTFHKSSIATTPTNEPTSGCYTFTTFSGSSGSLEGKQCPSGVQTESDQFGHACAIFDTQNKQGNNNQNYIPVGCSGLVQYASQNKWNVTKIINAPLRVPPTGTGGPVSSNGNGSSGTPGAPPPGSVCTQDNATEAQKEFCVQAYPTICSYESNQNWDLACGKNTDPNYNKYYNADAPTCLSSGGGVVACPANTGLQNGHCYTIMDSGNYQEFDCANQKNKVGQPVSITGAQNLIAIAKQAQICDNNPSDQNCADLCNKYPTQNACGIYRQWQDSQCAEQGYANDHQDKCSITGAVVVPIVNLLSAAVGVVIVLSVIIAGIQYITANGNPQTVAAAKGRLGKASLALAVYIFGFGLLQWLIPGGFFH